MYVCKTIILKPHALRPPCLPQTVTASWRWLGPLARAHREQCAYLSREPCADSLPGHALTPERQEVQITSVRSSQMDCARCSGILGETIRGLEVSFLLSGWARWMERFTRLLGKLREGSCLSSVTEASLFYVRFTEQFVAEERILQKRVNVGREFASVHSTRGIVYRRS